MSERDPYLRGVDTPNTLPGYTEFHELCDGIVLRITGALNHRHASIPPDPDDAEFFGEPDSIVTLQEGTSAAAQSLFCKHCVTGGRHGPNLEHLLDDDEDSLEKPPELTPAQMAENVRRRKKEDIRNGYRRRRMDRKLKRGH